MTKLMSTLAVVAGVAFADHSVTLSERDFREVRAIANPSIEVVPGPALAAVQPTVWINFAYASCATQRFAIQVETLDSVKLIKVTHPLQADCFGPTISRRYRLQVASDYRRTDQFVLLAALEATRTVPAVQPAPRRFFRRR